MRDADRRKLTLDVDAAAEPIAGVLHDDGGNRRSFVGWVGLAATLEHFLGPPSELPAAGSDTATYHEEDR